MPLRSPAAFRLEEEGPLQYLVRPAGAVAAAPAPVLVFLHGFDEGAPAPIERALTRHGPLRPSALACAEPFVIVAPQLPFRGDLWAEYATAVLRIVRRVQGDAGGDPERTYLTGFSFGGNGVFDLALLQPDAWAALWAVDPTRVPAGNVGAPVWLSFGEAARRGKPLFIRALNLQPFGSTFSNDRLYADEGADHVGSATLAYQDSRIYSWLLSKRRPGTR
jgi:predicted peptidase